VGGGGSLALEKFAVTVAFYCPTRFEVPSLFRKKTQVFGVGMRAAMKMAQAIHRNQDSHWHVVYGCAGALRPDLRAGQVFLIDRLQDQSDEPLLLHTPPNLKLPRASLSFSHSILRTPEQKQERYLRSNADLVDMEMSVLWHSLTPDLRQRVIFLRGVIDESQDSLQWTSVFRLMGRFLKYRRSMAESLTQVQRHLHIATVPAPNLVKSL
jgi:hypothetical protein